eukprot:scaffold2797_cov69-Phaeocystis_antarctica.AAC.5
MPIVQGAVCVQWFRARGHSGSMKTSGGYTRWYTLWRSCAMPPRAIAHEMSVHGHVMHSPERAALNATPLPQADGARHRRGGDDAQHRQLAGQGRRRCIGASRWWRLARDPLVRLRALCRQRTPRRPVLLATRAS